MKKVELEAAIKEIVETATGTKLTGVASAKMAKDIFCKIAEGIKKDEEVVLPVLGKIKLAVSAARSGEMNGKKWSKPETFTARLRVGKEFKEKLNS